MKPALAITVGDYNGIGPEVVLKSIRETAVGRICHPVLVGPREAFSFYARKFHFRLQLHTVPPGAAQKAEAFSEFMRTIPARGFALLESSLVAEDAIQPGRLSEHAGAAAVKAIEHGARLAIGAQVAGLVTAPVSKQAIHMAGASFPGQTEMVQHLSSSPAVAMMLVLPTLRVGLVTIHVPVANIASLLTISLLRERIRVVHQALVQDWGIRAPRLAVLALNPHAGEGGSIGKEEQRIIIPALEELQGNGMDIHGPFPADGFFARYEPRSYHAVIAMYHDQGLIPLKLTSSGRAVNFSAGLSIVRTSPDHGTAFAIAGLKKADPSSMIEAIKLAVRIAHNRRVFTHRNGL